MEIDLKGREWNKDRIKKGERRRNKDVKMEKEGRRKEKENRRRKERS